MGRVYSHDLRLKVVHAIDGGMNKMAAHRLFQVSRSTIDDWLRQREELGHVRPLPKVPSGKVAALGDRERFAAFVGRYSDRTLEGMSLAWAQENGRKLSRNTFSLALKKLGWTRKKRVSSTASDMKTNGASSRKS